MDALIGRDRERDALQRLLLREDSALVTVTGPGGMGKTRLALALAQTWRGCSGHAVAIVSLEAIRDPKLVAKAIAQAVGLQGQGTQPEWERVKDYLRESRLLLVLDNFEQVRGAGQLVGDLLREVPQVKVLVTSRVRLHLSGEQEFPLGPLELPRLPLDVPALEQVASVQLFVQRARALRPQFRLDESNAEAVAAICVRLDGWPLAIELAAARIKLLTPQQLVLHLQRRLQVLVGGPVDQPLRQRTLRATLDWSYELLEPAERALFARLSVFNGGAEIEAIEAVCAEAVPDVLQTLQSLVDHSLVQQQDGRFALPETIREYAAESLRDAWVPECRLAHAEYYLALAEQAEAEHSGPTQQAWFDRLIPQLDNFREAMAWCVRHQLAPMALRMACGLSLPCMLHGLGAEARVWLENGLSVIADCKDAARANAIAWLGVLCGCLGDVALARRYLEDALNRYRKLDDAPGIARTLTDLARAIVWHDGDLDAAERILEEALAIAQAIRASGLEGRAATTLGSVLTDRGDFGAARDWLRRGLSLSREAGDEWRITMALASLGHLYGRQGLFAQARLYAEQALARTRAGSNILGEAECLIDLAEYMRRDGDVPGGTAMLREALAKSLSVGDWRSAALALEHLAEIFLDGGKPLQAAKLLAAAAARCQKHGIGAAPAGANLVESLRSRARAQLGDSAFEAALRDGSTLSMAELTSMADSVDVKSARADERGAASELTPRELDVLHLVVGGLSDKQLAARLGISPTTASKHVGNLLGKTMSRNRLALTLWAMDRGLVAGQGARGAFGRPQEARPCAA